MTHIFMERKIYLESRHLDDKIYEHLLEKIRQDVLGNCGQEHGYVTKIYDNCKIISNIVSASGSGIFFFVKFKADIIKPQVNSEYKGKVCMIFSAGIFVKIFDKMKVLIPTDNMNGYKFDSISSCFKKRKKSISQDDIVDIRIDIIKYEKQNFDCIGTLL